MAPFSHATRAGYFIAVLFITRALVAQEVDYERDVKSLLAAKCAACHGALKQESGLRLDAGKLILAGGEGGAAIAPGDANVSELIARVSSDDPDIRMPPEGEGERLTDEQVTLLRRWIDAGAKFPADEAIPPTPGEHWAYQVPVRANLPKVADPALQKNPIDAFLAAKHESLGLTRVEPAPKHVLLRRVYLDLVGLPPTREQLAAFLADDSPNAYEKVVDRLLASEQYGERWGRHWMDIWRYSDWSGYKNEIRNSQRHIWRWRDWIIQSLNEDKPYDRMIVEMLAGDEVAPTDPDTLRATGFLARNWYKFNRHAWLDNTVEHTSKAFLGMTLNCAKCHDHKYDPLPQQQYYQFRAMFEPHDIRTDAVGGESDLNKDGLPRAYDKDLTAATYLFERGNEKNPVKDKPLSPAVPKMFGIESEVSAVELPVEAYYPAIQPAKIEARLADARKALQTAKGEWQRAAAQSALSALQARIAADRAKYHQSQTDLSPLAKAAARAEKESAVAAARLALHKAEQALEAAKRQAEEKPDDKKTKDALSNAEKHLAEGKKKLGEAEKALKNPGEKYTPLGEEHPRTSSGRRLALANWIVDRRNPLTARVAVNHIWLRHFGAPLVENVFDFGLNSPRPEHVELLDWLAVELVQNDWKMKRIHRLIVTSQTYRLSSSLKDVPHQSFAADADNRCYWRMNSRPLEAEAIRDSLLAVAGNLDEKLGGPEIDEGQGQTSRRRSVYLRHAYEKKMQFLEMFDAANETDCYRRSESIVPQQALALANSRLCLEQSRLLAGKLTDAVRDRKMDDKKTDEFVVLAYRTILSRDPASDELDACRDFLGEQAQRLADAKSLTSISGGPNVSVSPANNPQQRARENLVHVLMNHNDFVTIH